MTLNGVPIDPAATYRVTTNDFLANSDDGFTTLTVGTNRVYAPGFDLDALAAYLNPGPAPRTTETASSASADPYAQPSSFTMRPGCRA